MISDHTILHEDQSATAPFYRRISWPAVFAGVVIVLVVQLALSLLGVGIGASTFDPLTEQNPFSGMGTGSSIWLGLSTLVSLFAGGWVAGRLSGQVKRLDNSLHGVLAWGMASLVTAYLLSSAVGGMVRGTAGLVGKGASIVGSAATAMAPEIAASVKEQVAESGLDLSQIKAEAMTLLRQSGKPALQPSELAQDAQDLSTDTQNTMIASGKDPQGAEADFSGLIDRVFAKGETALDAVDKEAMVNVLVARTNMSRDEAATTVDRWKATAQQAQAKFTQMKEESEIKAREAADVAARGIAKGAFWSFVALVLGAFSAAFGGSLALPRVRNDEVRGPRLRDVKLSEAF